MANLRLCFPRRFVFYGQEAGACDGPRNQRASLCLSHNATICREFGARYQKFLMPFSCAGCCLLLIFQRALPRSHSTSVRPHGYCASAFVRVSATKTTRSAVTIDFSEVWSSVACHSTHELFHSIPHFLSITSDKDHLFAYDADTTTDRALFMCESGASTPCLLDINNEYVRGTTNAPASLSNLGGDHQLRQGVLVLYPSPYREVPKQS